MWIPEQALQTLGFRQRSRHYWQCESGFNLPSDAHISIFASSQWTDDSLLRFLDVDTFHITFHLSVDNIHFYFHEYGEHLWEAGGHTSRAEIERHGIELEELQTIADVIAALLTDAWCGTLRARG